jgi:hypothetical protein
MKRIAWFCLSGMVLASLLVTLAAAQTDSLGDYARSVRKDKADTNSAKKFDNDNLPSSDTLSVVGPAADPVSKPPDGPLTPVETATNTSPKSDDAAKLSEKKGVLSLQEQEKLNDSWKGKISGQKDQIDLLARELDVTQKEYQLRAAAMYADAGNRLRNAGDWDKQDAEYKQQIADKQKALDDAKQRLEEMQEDARKQGVPSSARE